MFTNINAKENLENGFELYFFANMGFLESVFEKDRIFLINEETMDRIYPPRKRLSLDERCLKEMLTPLRERRFDFEEELRFTDEFLERLEKCRENTKGTVAVGLFVPDLSKDLARKLNLNDTRELIFICPERLNSWAIKIKRFFPGISDTFIKKIIASKILFHELAHKYMYDPSDSNRYNVSWKQLIEESLANAIAFKLLSGSLRSKAVVSKAILEQPFEYRQYHWWLDYKKGDFIGFFEWYLFCCNPFARFDLAAIAKQWKFKDMLPIDEDWWYRCKYILDYPPFHRIYRELRYLIEEMPSGEYLWKTTAINMIKKAAL